MEDYEVTHESVAKSIFEASISVGNRMIELPMALINKKHVDTKY